MAFRFSQSNPCCKYAFLSTPFDRGEYAGIEGYVKFASTRDDGYMNQLTIHHDCPGWGENDRRLLERRMQTSCADDDLRAYGESCDDNEECASNWCRFGTCRCTEDSECPVETPVCVYEGGGDIRSGFCYTGNLAYNENCADGYGYNANERCASGYCEAPYDKCRCTEASDCPGSTDICASNARCYSSGLAYDEVCGVADSQTSSNTRCSSNRCSGTYSTSTCLCSDDSDCPETTDICASTNARCYSSGLAYGEECGVASDETASNARCSSNRCSGTYSTSTCLCSEDSDCPGSTDICASTDDRCYSSGLAVNAYCGDDMGSAVDERCASGYCEAPYDKCRCTDNSHCPDNKPTCGASSTLIGLCSSVYGDICNTAGPWDSTSCDDGYRCSKRDNEADLKCRKEDGESCTKNLQCSSRCCKNQKCKSEDKCHKGDFYFSHECTNNDDCENYAEGLLCKQCGINKCKRPNGWKCTGSPQCASDCCKGPAGSKTCKHKDNCGNDSCLNDPN